MVDSGVRPSVVELNKAEVIRNFPGAMIQPITTSFVVYMIEPYGMVKLKRLMQLLLPVLHLKTTALTFLTVCVILRQLLLQKQKLA